MRKVVRLVTPGGEPDQNRSAGSHLMFRSISTGLSPDPPHRRHPRPRRDGSSNHAASSEPPPAAVGSEELRMRVQHPGEGPTHPGCALQLVLHPVPEHVGEQKSAERNLQPFMDQRTQNNHRFI